MAGGRVEDYLESIKKTEEELREGLRPLATKNVTQSLVLGEISNEEKVEVSDGEIESEIKNLIDSSSEDKDKLDKVLKTPQAQRSIRRLLLTRKTLQQLLEIAKGSGE